MTSAVNFENYQFNQNINTIGNDFFPHQFPLHWHKYIEVIAAFDSEDTEVPDAVIQINQTMHTLRPGDILFVWPGELHEIIKNEGQNLVGLQFNTGLLSELSDFAPYTNLFRTIHHMRALELPGLTMNMHGHIKNMLEIRASRGPFHNVECQICLYEMFMDFANFIRERMASDKLGSGAIGSNTLEKMNLACNYIIENCNQELSLESVADYIGFSACYFSRIFKQATSYNFVEYLTLQRVKRAQALLVDSNLAITEISYQSGFKSISTFNRVFKQYRSCSPREYRKYYLT